MDLLDPCKTNLEIKEDKFKGIYVKDLSWEYVSSPVDIFRLLALGEAHRVTRATKMNPNSSRSHCNFCIRLEKTEVHCSSHTSNANLIFFGVPR
jgi:hypothetical protein